MTPQEVLLEWIRLGQIMQAADPDGFADIVRCAIAKATGEAQQARPHRGAPVLVVLDGGAA